MTDLEIEAQKVNAKPGDLVALRVEQGVSPDRLRHLAEHWRKALPDGVQGVVILGDLRIDDEMVERAAEGLYAAGPWGDFFCFADGGVRAITDAHSMEVYRRMARDVLTDALQDPDTGKDER